MPQRFEVKNIVIEGNVNFDPYIGIVHSLFARGEDQLIAIRDIIEERAAQDKLHGTSSLRKDMMEEDWLGEIRIEAKPDGKGDDFRLAMVKIAAIALAAIEAQDGRKHRGDKTPGV